MGIGAALVALSAFGVVRSRSNDDRATSSAVVQPAVFAAASGATLDIVIEGLEERVEDLPSDYFAHAGLGMFYVQQARVTGDGNLYDSAATSLATSLEINKTDNFLPMPGARRSISSSTTSWRPGTTHGEAWPSTTTARSCGGR